MAASSTPIHGSHGRLDGVAARLRPSRRCARPRDSSLLRTAGLLPDLVDLIDQVEEFLGLVQIHGRFRLRALCDGLLQNVLQLRKLRVMLLRLVPVAPEDVEMVLGQLCPLLFDHDRPLPVHLVLRVVVLLDDVVDGLRLDSRLLRVVDPTRQIAVGLDRPAGANPLHQIHGANSSYTMNHRSSNQSTRCGYMATAWRPDYRPEP